MAIAPSGYGCWLRHRARGAGRAARIPPDSGLAGKRGGFTAVEWNEEDKQKNPLRRGFVRATANHHAIEQADGTPFFIIGDTWYSAATNRFRWYDDETSVRSDRKPASRIIFATAKPRVTTRSRSLRCFRPGRQTASQSDIFMSDHTCVRSAWTEYGTRSAKNMENEGGRPFLFPGKVPGYENLYPGRQSPEPGLLPVHGSEDRLFEPAGFHSVH